MCAVVSCPQDTQKSRHGSQRLTTGLQDDLSSQCLVRLHHVCCPEALIRRAVRVGLYPADGPNLHQLVADMDDALFARIQANEQLVLQQLLPAHTCYKYVLRSRRRDYVV